MARRLWPVSRRWQIVAVVGAVVLIFAAVIMVLQWDRRPSLQSMGISAPIPNLVSVVQGAEWQVQTVDAEGFSQVADNDRFSLSLNPRTSQITILDKDSNYEWRSNPTKEQLGKETVKGALLANLESPYILEYVSASQTRRLVKNTMDTNISISYIPMKSKGIQATYMYKDLQLSFVIQYLLTEHGLEAVIPTEGIIESGDNKVFAINLLPFFGGVSKAQESGYLFVPDGPGGLIYFDQERPANIRSYEFPIYGDDVAGMKSIKTLREQISYPVFGLKRGDQAFAAILKEGQYSASIKAVLPGNISSYHTVSTNFSYRQEYGRRVSGITKEVVITVQKERIHHDRRVEYRLLSGEDADYVGMAGSYREYLEENGKLDSKLTPTDKVPIQLSIIGGGMKPKFGGSRYEPTTTFHQAEQIVKDLLMHGISNIRLTYQGWQNSGHIQTDERFPVSSELGGNKGAKQFIATMHDSGVEVFFEDFIAWRNSEASSFDIKSDGIRTIDSTVLQNEWFGPHPFTQFIVNPIEDIRKEKGVIHKLKELGVDGIHYVDGPGNLLFSDYNPDAPLSRKETAYYYESLLNYAQKELGTVGVYRGFDYTLDHVTFIEGLPFDSSNDIIIDETVPFYPMVVHGVIEYTAAAGNLRADYEGGLLKAIEYGAIPYFKLTYSESRVLQETDYEFVYSSEYAIWKDRILDEYEKFSQLTAIYNQQMTDHAKVAEGVYVTTYEDGTSVRVDYNTNKFDVMKGGVR